MDRIGMSITGDWRLAACLQDLSPGSVEEAEEAEPDDEFKDAIDVSN